GRQEGVATKCLQAVNAERRQTAIFLRLGNTLDSELAWEVAEVIGRWDIAGGMQIVQTCANHVDEAGTEGVGVAKSALLSVGRLVPLSEAAAVGYTAEDTWDELRIVGQTKTEENLILVAEVDVHSCVEGIAVLKQLR